MKRDRCVAAGASFVCEPTKPTFKMDFVFCTTGSLTAAIGFSYLNKELVTIRLMC